MTRTFRRMRDSPFPFSIHSFARFQEISVNEAVDPFHLPDQRSSARARWPKCEILNDRRIEKTLNGRVNKRPSGPKKEEEEKSDDGVGDALQICEAVDFLRVDLSMAEFHPFVLVLCEAT